MAGTLEFKILREDEESRARVGLLRTRRGSLETPAYVFPATYGEVPLVSAEEVKSLGVQGVMANAFQLWRTGLWERVEKAGGLNKYMRFEGVTMTDSGGFQVLSYGMGRSHRGGKIAFPNGMEKSVSGGSLVRVYERGVGFRVNGEEIVWTPEFSVALQEKVNADVVFAFDECHSVLSSDVAEQRRYARESLERSHRWEKASLDAKSSKQVMFGVVHGANFQDLRVKSARYISGLSFDGVAIGGFLGGSKEEMHRVIEWTVPCLAEEKPRHLLGIGQVDDVFECVARGVDMFDCVEVTRLARHDCAYVKSWEGAGGASRRGVVVLRYSKLKDDVRPIEEGCACGTCRDYARAGLVRLKSSGKEDEKRLYRALVTRHNIFFVQDLLKRIREAIGEGTFAALKAEYGLV